MAKGPKAFGPPKPPSQTKAVQAAPRLKPVSTREYGKGGTPLAQGPNMWNYGGNVGYGGPSGLQV